MLRVMKPERYAAQVFIEVTKGLNYLHQNNIIHKDIKLQNIIKADGILKIADFGLSERNGKMGKSICGTKFYLAPEIMEQKDYNEKVDIWSMGVMIYIMCAGHIPFLLKEGV